MRQIDDPASGDADFETVDLALELAGKIVAAISTRRRCARYDQRHRRRQRQRDREQRSAEFRYQSHGECPLAPLKRPPTVSTGAALTLRRWEGSKGGPGKHAWPA